CHRFLLRSIQSHVVRGYVGNKCSVFPLQLLGFDVDPVNSVQFSNHTGMADEGWYSSFTGEILQGDQLTSLVDGLERNSLLDGYTHMLTGYIGSPSFLRAVIGVFHKLKEVNSGLRFVCDPVLGDGGRLYVPEGNVDIYRNEVLPIATVITPNQFEAELLSGVEIRTEDDACRACAALHEKGPETVVITSCTLEDQGDDIFLFASICKNGKNGEGGQGNVTGSRTGAMTGRMNDEGDGESRVPPLLELYKMTFPRIPQTFTGTGDLMASLLLAWMHTLPNDFPGALERVGGTLQAVLARTHI
ncbi:unnamed protein product, partial [Choristocarpus tenellus]